MGGCAEIVFIVDDDLAVRESLKFALELDGLLVRVCATGAEFLRHPDLPNARCLVLDCRMPEMDGFEILESLGTRELRLPVILTTSYATPIFRRRAAAAGIGHILEKPLLDAALIDRIHDILRGQAGAT